MTEGIRLTLLLCVAEVFTMIGSMAFAALLPTFIEAWGLSNTEAGWISAVYFAGYTVAVPLLVSATDRIDARLVYIGGAAIAALASVGFAMFADGFWSALLFRSLAGVGLAGTYMPGLRALVDRYKGATPSRALAFYTSSFGLGTAFSYLIAGEVGRFFGWETAFFVAAIAAAVATVLVAAVLRPQRPEPVGEPTSILDFRPVLRNRPALGYILAYTVHNFELFGFRGWVVAFLAFSLARTGRDGILTPTTVATLTGFIAMASSILFQEVAVRLGRRRVIAIVMLASAAIACVYGFLGALPYEAVIVLTVVYTVAQMADSAALTAGTVESSESGRRGATLAVHSVMGFAGAAFGPLVFGVVLDAAGGSESLASWGLAFAAIGLTAALGPLAMVLSARKPTLFR